MALRRKPPEKLEEELFFKEDIKDNPDNYILLLECSNPGHSFRIGYIYMDGTNKKLTFSILRGVLRHFRSSENISTGKHYCLYCRNARIYCIRDIAKTYSAKLSEESTEKYKDKDFVLRVLEKDVYIPDNVAGEFKVVQKDKEFYWKFERNPNYKAYEKSIFSENFITQIPKTIKKMYEKIIRLL